MLHDFEARDGNELGMKKGQRLRLAPKHLQPTGLRGWLLAASRMENDIYVSEQEEEEVIRIGLVPANRIKVLGRTMGNASNTNNQAKPDLVKSSN